VGRRGGEEGWGGAVGRRGERRRRGVWMERDEECGEEEERWGDEKRRGGVLRGEEECC
jgi:hypothetical protein